MNILIFLVFDKNEESEMQVLTTKHTKSHEKVFIFHALHEFTILLHVLHSANNSPA